MKKIKFTSSRYNAFTVLWFVLGLVFMTLLPLKANAIATEPVPTALAAQIRQTQPIHILLIGQDRRESESRSRSDCMILCTFQPEEGSITLTSFLRDLYVRVPGYGKNRLNAAYAFGGMELIRQTFLENFGIYVDGCVEVDFGQFHELIDLLGGVTLHLRPDEAAHINMEVPSGSLQAGVQHLNGSQALAYSRIRSLDEDGDFSRTNRQRNILTALLKRCANASAAEMIRLFRKAAPMVSTDIPKRQFLVMIRELTPLLSSPKVISQHIPAEGTYCHRIIDGMAVLDADLEAARRILQSSLMGK